MESLVALYFYFLCSSLLLYDDEGIDFNFSFNFSWMEKLVAALFLEWVLCKDHWIFKFSCDILGVTRAKYAWGDASSIKLDG